MESYPFSSPLLATSAITSIGGKVGPTTPILNISDSLFNFLIKHCARIVCVGVMHAFPNPKVKVKISFKVGDDKLIIEKWKEKSDD